LDHNVDAALAPLLRNAGHRCLTAGEVGLGDADDDMISVWADDHDAVVFTHDKEFIIRRRKNTFAKHVLLDCADQDAYSVIEKNLDEIILKVNSREAVVVRASQDFVTSYPTRWD